ncbi:hypothetical protein WH47_02143 [Habropoda laboriosa]|uniref:Histone-lysine N-methyltransferase SETMAR n=1 Tax=Habropoda laboriosa TaxID=597456 RepID=A0A0L7RIV8_9HYME|nr:hypothetical protein WH47_02143 [Habropoda laboriosa]
MECSHTAIEKHLHSMGKVQKCGAWVPHALSDNSKNQRATISVGCQNFHFSIWHTNHERFFQQCHPLYTQHKCREQLLRP